jgi:hypothetical protein
MRKQDRELLQLSLSVAVPIVIEEVASWSPERRITYCQENVDVITGQGDNLMYKSKKKGETAKVFNVLARCLACLAFQPDGVDFDGMHWDALGKRGR